MTSADTISRILDSTDLRTLVAEYVPLRKHGSRFTGPCPFHQERTASFGVNPGLNIWKCFGCGAGGDALDFVQKIESVPFPAALERLAHRAGIELTAESPQIKRQTVQEMRQAHELAWQAEQWQRWMIEALEALGSRMYADLDTAAYDRWCQWAPLLHRLKTAAPSQIVAWYMAVRNPRLSKVLRARFERREAIWRVFWDAWDSNPSDISAPQDLQDMADAAAHILDTQ